MDSGRLLAGKGNAKFTDAIWIVVLGTFIADVLGIFIVGIIASLIVLFIWIALIKHFFDCGWLKAIAIGIIAILFFTVISVILGLVGIVILTFIWRQRQTTLFFFASQIRSIRPC